MPIRHLQSQSEVESQRACLPTFKSCSSSPLDGYNKRQC